MVYFIKEVLPEYLRKPIVPYKLTDIPEQKFKEFI
jgi:hypothetical protein